jgi:hypothetical protein
MFNLNASSTEILISTPSNQQLFSSSPLNPPSCIVIGCKNGNGLTNPNVKYYQVPFIHQTTSSNTNTYRQWYINTLREDLLDYVNSQQQQQHQQNPIHFVCIEHFDEESFLIENANVISLNSPPDEIMMVLKEDAVPSLFEIEVFQRMIAHQEQVSLNQQKQLQQQQNQFEPISAANVSFHHATPQRSSLLSNLILNECDYHHQGIFSCKLSTTTQIMQETLKSTSQEMQSTGGSASPMTSSQVNKRTRIDPDMRAALIQRVPKAVKRTSAMGHPKNQQQFPLIPPVKMQKAVKHTMPRPNQQQQYSSNITIINDIAPSASPSSLIQINNGHSLLNPSAGKSSSSSSFKHTSNNNVFLKDLPPVTSSTNNNNNKAVKHTGGGSNAYYQNKSLLSQHSNSLQDATTHPSKTPVLASLVSGADSTNHTNLKAKKQLNTKQ